jgi:cytochrome P450
VNADIGLMAAGTSASMLLSHAPYAVLKSLRERSPVFRGAHGLWICTRHAEVDFVLRDKHLFLRDFERTTREAMGAHSLERYSAGVLRHWLVNQNGARHQMLRSRLAKALRSERWQGLEDRLRVYARGLLGQPAAEGYLDLVRQYAFPLTAWVICELLGIPDDERSIFIECSIVPPPELVEGAPPDCQAAAHADAQIQRLIQYFEALCERKRGQAASDLVGDLLQAQQQEPELSTECIAAHLYFMFFAGHQSTQNMIVNSLYHLLSDREQLARLRADRGGLPAAVQELMRFDSAVQISHVHYAQKDLILGGQQVLAGEGVLPLLGAANHDPEWNDKPERLDLSRPAAQHCSFGLGQHFCLGAKLATMEIEVAIDTLMTSLPTLRLARNFRPPWFATYTLRGLRHLPAYCD